MEALLRMNGGQIDGKIVKVEIKEEKKKRVTEEKKIEAK